MPARTKTKRAPRAPSAQNRPVSKTSKTRPRKKNPTNATKPTDPSKTKRRFRYHPGKRAKIEIRRTQKRKKRILRHRPFVELTRQYIQYFNDDPKPMRVRDNALKALQAVFESMAVQTLCKVESVTRASGRKSVTEKDFDTVQEIESY